MTVGQLKAKLHIFKDEQLIMIPTGKTYTEARVREGVSGDTDFMEIYVVTDEDQFEEDKNCPCCQVRTLPRP